jgi:phytoene synthase
MDELAQSHAYCQRLARRSAGNFYYAFWLLPPAQRRGMCALYSFLRETDDLVDDDALGLSSEERRQRLAQWKQGLGCAMLGEYSSPVHAALVETVVKFAIPGDCLQESIRGAEMDLEPRRYATFAELTQYCYRVASVVGLACIRIWGCRDAGAERLACDCGLAFQLTNILRDLQEDALRGRVYLPTEDFQRFDYDAEGLAQGVQNESFRALFHFQAARALEYFDRGAQLEAMLSPLARPAFRTMYQTYRALLVEMQRLDGDVFSQRVRLTRWHKLRVAAASLAAAPLPRRSARATA